MWEYYDGSSMAWRQYTRTRDIAIADPARVPGSCSYRQTSSLTLVLKAEDSQRQYRCTLQKNFETKSAIITIGKVSPKGRLQHYSTFSDSVFCVLGIDIIRCRHSYTTLPYGITVRHCHLLAHIDIYISLHMTLSCISKLLR